MSTLTQHLVSPFRQEVGSLSLCCPVCNSTNVRRTRRRGFVERHLLPVVHKYPWRCLSCRGSFIARCRSFGEEEHMIGDGYLPRVRTRSRSSSSPRRA